MKTRILVIPAIVVLIIASGCITRTTVENEPRQSVRFTSQQAAETFYEAYLANYYPSNKTNNFHFWIGLPALYTHHYVETDNVHFNEAVQLADTNHDGTISDAEAQTYAARTSAQAAAKK
jgi:hypothetical protein